MALVGSTGKSSKPKKAPKPKSFQVGLTETSIAPGQQQKAGNNKTQKQVAATSGYSASGATTPTEARAGTKKGVRDIKRVGKSIDAPGKDPYNAGPKSYTRKSGGTRKANADTFGFTQPVMRKKRTGGTVMGDGGGGGGSRFDRFQRGMHDTGAIGAQDGGKLSGSFRDSNLVGSQNTIEDFDGTEFSGGGNEGAGGGGSGSALAGRESVGLLSLKKGQSVEEAVYGVQRRRGKVSKVRGE